MKTNALSGIDGLAGLGELKSGLRKAIYDNQAIIVKVLKQSEQLSGLGFVENKKIPFPEVVRMYNEGISEAEIKAWVWYKRKQGVPMTHWNKIYKITDSDLPGLVKNGAMFVCGEALMPLPIYSFGNMYDRRDQLMQDKEHITKTYGKQVFENHLKVVTEAIPKQLSVTEPDPKERPIIMAISELARNKEQLAIRSVRPEFMDAEKAEQLTRVNGKTTVKRDSSSSRYKVIKLQFDGETDYSLRDVFVKWLYTLQQADFDKSNAIDVAEYYLYNKPLKDDEMTPDQKAELKVNARNEGEKLFSRFLYEVLTPEDQKRLDETWNRMYNAQSDINHKRVPVGFECSSRFKSGLLQITPIQREGVAFFEALGSGICAFDVGVGKTITAIINIAANIYSGKCKRPLVVVPKPTYRKWIGEIIGYTDKNTKEFVPGVLSYTNITLNDWFNLGTGIKEKINFSKQVPENSITLVTYEGFKQIGFSGNVSEELFTELALKTVKIRLFDHIIYTEKGYYSFTDHGALNGFNKSDMITVENIIREYPRIDQSILPQALNNKEFEFIRENIDLYNDDETIKKYIDTFVEKLNEVINKHTPENEVKKKSQSPKTPKEPIVEKNPVEETTTHVEKVSLEVSLIKRYVGLHNKTKDKQQILNFLNTLQKAIIEKRIRKTSGYATEIENIQEQLIKCYKQMGKTIRVNIGKETLEAYSAIARSEKAMLSVMYIKQYIGLHGKQGVKEKAAVLHGKIEKAIETGKIINSDPYFDEISEIRESLKKYIENKTQTPAITESTLNGIVTRLAKRPQKGRAAKYPHEICQTENGLNGAEEEHVPNAAPATSVIPVSELAGMAFETIGLQGKYRELIGDPSVGFSAMVFGLPKSGKSTLCIDFARHLSENHGKVLYVAIEEKFGYTLKEKFERLNVFHPNLLVAETLPNDLSPFQFVFIDSVSKATMSSHDLTKLRNENPKVAFVFVFHSTKKGDFRGQQEYAHDVDVIIEVENGVAKAKGRFGIGGRVGVFN